MGFIDELNLTAKYIEAYIHDNIIGNGSSARLDEAIAYSLLGGGKRLRAYLVCEFCELCGRNRFDAADYASAIEMIHAFSLIHDDLPAMDNDDMRRGKPSNHVAFGEATAILAGDSLALDAFKTICLSCYCSPHQNEKAVLALSEYAGSKGMCAGQQYDIDSEGKKFSLDELTKLVDLKTGALFSCAGILGCIAAGADETESSAAERFGLYCGRAFQITDDLLDINSTPEELGKTTGKDEKQQKSTFVSLLGEEGARTYARDCIKKAKEALDLFQDSPAKKRLIEFADYILIRKK